MVFEDTEGEQKGDALVPGFEIDVNLIGPAPIMSIPDILRYEPGFSLDVLVDLAFPIGEYDNEQAVNLGQNRWYGRVGAPIVWQLGPRVPGRRTTLELLPSIWFFSNNDDYVSGLTLETDPMFQLEGHLTRDFTETLWGSPDGVWVTGGESTIDGQSGSALNNIGVGYTLGYNLNENTQLTIGYVATINRSDPEDLRLDTLRASLVYGWHSVIEGIGRLGD